MEKINNYVFNKDIKIKNPHTIRNNSVNYECEHHNFDFKIQKKNYDKLKDSLGEFGIMFTKIYASRWSNRGEPQNPNKYVFVVETNSQVVWYRYESEADGSAQNYIFMGKKRIKMTTWIESNYDERRIMIEEMNYNIV